MAASDSPHSGQPCPQPGCNGVLRVETTRVCGEYRRRYLKCNQCHCAPEHNLEIVKLQYAPPQSPRRKYFSIKFLRS